MCGGGGWDPGEATDDTQMAVLVGESLLECDGLELPDVFRRFQRWAAAEPKDIGLQTEAVLSGGDPWDLAAALHFQTSGRAAGNGALMRASTSAVYFAGDGTGADPLEALPGSLNLVHPVHRARYATVLTADWHPDRATAGGLGVSPRKNSNGAVWPCLGSAVWALRSTCSYEDAVRAAVDLGGDTDTVAAVTGGLAGAVYGVEGIPGRWVEPLHVPLPGFDERTLRAPELVELAERLSWGGRAPEVPGASGRPKAPGAGAPRSPRV
ncbi:ADP-ribosylglycohydrolase family protein [Streptomyces montanus]|uniref:ADP-ribosylglycohydrolase family protein n=1 Tax=Streptomyces montanus TaxID=2580423 RepID=A0A5R9FDK3_9ACTN|nr:ADP-ribosylglycohydrolase family protein [Streptomyces montanus]